LLRATGLADASPQFGLRAVARFFSGYGRRVARLGCPAIVRQRSHSGRRRAPDRIPRRFAIRYGPGGSESFSSTELPGPDLGGFSAEHPEHRNAAALVEGISR